MNTVSVVALAGLACLSLSACSRDQAALEDKATDAASAAAPAPSEDPLKTLPR